MTYNEYSDWLNKNPERQAIDRILEIMLTELQEGGMDTSYGGTMYLDAKKNAITAILEEANNI